MVWTCVLCRPDCGRLPEKAKCPLATLYRTSMVIQTYKRCTVRLQVQNYAKHNEIKSYDTVSRIDHLFHQWSNTVMPHSQPTYVFEFSHRQWRHSQYWNCAHHVIFFLPDWSVRHTILQLIIVQLTSRRPAVSYKFSRYLRNSSIC